VDCFVGGDVVDCGFPAYREAQDLVLHAGHQPVPVLRVLQHWRHREEMLHFQIVDTLNRIFCAALALDVALHRDMFRALCKIDEGGIPVKSGIQRTLLVNVTINIQCTCDF